MKPEVKDKWLKALRSGEYIQGNGFLKEGDKFCSLGVLCDLAAKEGVGKWEAFVHKLQVFKTSPDTFHPSFPPNAVVEWAGLPSRSPTIMSGKYSMRNLGALNDIDKLSFGQIADLIEEQL